MKDKRIMRLKVIQKEMYDLNEEAISLLPTKSTDKKIAKLHWYSTIKCALGYKSNNAHFCTINDSVRSLK